jgi:hypothetical protein
MEVFLIEFAIQAFATLVGAAAAFGLEALRRRHERRYAQIEQFKAALFVLILHRTFLRTLHSQHLSPRREDPIRPYSLPPILVAPTHEHIDLLALSFLLSSKEAELLNKLGVAEAQYRTVVALVEQRNQLHLAVQAKLQAASDTTGMSQGTLDDIRGIAGKMLSRQLEDLTNDLYRTTEHAIGFNRDVYVAAVSIFKRLFPKSSMFGVEDLPLSKPDAA